MATLVVKGMRCKPSAFLAASVTALALAACGDAAPSGQVVANVAGTDVTERELQGVRPRSGTDVPQGAALETLVWQKVLAAEARSRSLDNDADYHFALRAATDRLLIEALARDIRGALAVPNAAQIERFMQANPQSFGKRALLRVRRSADAEAGQPLTIDTANLSDAEYARMTAIAPGDSAMLAGERWTLISRESRPWPRAAQIEAARESLIERRVAAELEKIVRRYRHGGLIRYQEGQGPARSDIR